MHYLPKRRLILCTRRGSHSKAEVTQTLLWQIVRPVSNPQDGCGYSDIIIVLFRLFVLFFCRGGGAGDKATTTAVRLYR